MRRIGLHVRITNTILQAIDYAQQLDMPIFQCFLVNQTDRQPLTINASLAHQFKTELNNRQLFVHGSYWFNLAQLSNHGFAMLKNEIHQAQQLGAHHIILHPGSGMPGQMHEQSIAMLAKTLNKLMTQEPEMLFILENTAHAYYTIGSNLLDFYQLKQQLEHPDRLRFCIDTAHAHAYGYDLVSTEGQQEFINLIDQTMGIDAIELIHLNDATHPRESHIDKHALLGQGAIGIEALQSFALHPRFATIPIILELPYVSQQEDEKTLQIVRGWSK